MSEVIEGRIGTTLEDIESYKNHPIVRDVWEKSTSFVGEVEDFYDMGIDGKITEGQEVAINFWLNEDDPNKRGESPTNLVDVLEGLSEKEFDREKLQYDSVRDYFIKHQYVETELKNDIISGFGKMGLFTVGVGSLPCMMTENLEYVIPLGFLGVGILMAGYFISRSAVFEMEISDSLYEFLNLHNTAYELDSVVYSNNTQ